MILSPSKSHAPFQALTGMSGMNAMKFRCNFYASVSDYRNGKQAFFPLRPRE
jgi:hypothetical protein